MAELGCRKRILCSRLHQPVHAAAKPPTRRLPALSKLFFFGCAGVESTTAGLVSLSAVVFVAGVGLLVARRVRARSADVSEKMTLLNTDEGVVV